MPCPVPLAPDTAVCGNGGTCVANESRCACVDGWSGRGDFVFGEPSCNIYLPAIKYLWVPVFVVHLIVLPFALENVFRILKKSRTAKSLRSLRLPLVFGILVVLANVFMSATALIKFSHPDETIGTDALVTTTFCIGTASFWVSATTFIALFIEINTHNMKIRDTELRERFDKAFNNFKIYNPIVSALTVLWMSMPMYMLASSSQEAFFGLGFCHYVGAGITIAIYGLVMLPGVTTLLQMDVQRVIAGLEAAQLGSAEGGRLRTLESRVARVRKEIKNQAIINFPTALLMGCWPLLQSGSSYFLPFAWLSAGICTAAFLLMSAPSERKLCCAGFLQPNTSSIHDNTHDMMKSSTTQKSNRVVQKQDSAAASALQSSQM